MKQEFTKAIGGGINLSITCEECGKPINQVDEQWGMDCDNWCSRTKAQQFAKDNPNDPMVRLMGLLQSPRSDAEMEELFSEVLLKRP